MTEKTELEKQKTILKEQIQKELGTLWMSTMEGTGELFCDVEDYVLDAVDEFFDKFECQSCKSKDAEISQLKERIKEIGNAIERYGNRQWFPEPPVKMWFYMTLDKEIAFVIKEMKKQLDEDFPELAKQEAEL